MFKFSTLSIASSRNNKDQIELLVAKLEHYASTIEKQRKRGALASTRITQLRNANFYSNANRNNDVNKNNY